MEYYPIWNWEMVLNTANSIKSPMKFGTTYPKLVSAPPDLEDWVALLNGHSL